MILDLQNQLIQVKTQVAIAIADEHLFAKKHKENLDKSEEWMRKAELAVDKNEDDLARAALKRVESYRELARNFAQYVTDQRAQVENLKIGLRQLDQKLTEAQAKADLLIARQHRARAVSKASDAKVSIADSSISTAFDRSICPLAFLHAPSSRRLGAGFMTDSSKKHQDGAQAREFDQKSPGKDSKPLRRKTASRDDDVFASLTAA